MIKVFVPATSANVGAGFDTLGLALSLGNTVEMEEAEGCAITSADGQPIPTGRENLVYQAAEYFYRQCGKTFRGMRLVQQSPIPVTKGLGSSSACIVAGLFGANVLLGYPCSRQQLLTMAAGIEGHPDNVAPALLGGLVASCIEGEQVHSVKKEISPGLCFAAFVPDYELPTHRAREALPKKVPMADAVYNLSRAALCQAAFCEGRLDLLEVVTGDRLHQPPRFAMMPGARQVFELAKQAGAPAVFVSGAGPTVLAAVHRGDEAFWQKAEQALEAARQSGDEAARYSLARLEPDNVGTRLM